MNNSRNLFKPLMSALPADIPLDPLETLPLTTLGGSMDPAALMADVQILAAAVLHLSSTLKAALSRVDELERINDDRNNDGK